MGRLITSASQPQPIIKSYQELGQEQHGEQFSSDAVVAQLNLNLFKAMGVDRAFPSEDAFIEAYDNIQKALATGTVSGMADATALRLENLDDVMTSVLYGNEHLVLWNWLGRTVSKQPTFEWNRRKRYGGGRRTAGFVEGGTPKSATGAWERNTIQTKYMGVRRGVTHQAITTGLLGGFQISPTEEEERSGTLDLLGIIERWLVHGNKDFHEAGGGEINYDGILELMADALAAGQIDDRNVIDKGGEPLDFDDLEEGALNLFKVGKLNNTANLGLFCDPSVVAGLSLQKLPAERAALGTDAGTGQYTVGLPLSGYKTNRGLLTFKESIFLEPVDGNDPVLVLADTEPTAPSSPATCTTAASSDSGATWDGTFYYYVSSFHDGGESVAIVDSGGAQAVTAGQKVTVTIGVVPGAHGYRVYRGLLSDGTDAKYVGAVAQPSSGSTVDFVDTNARIPGTTDVMILHNEQASLVLAQMAPLIKFPLAPVSTTLEFLLLLYHVLVLKAPERQIWYKNVGSYLPA